MPRWGFTLIELLITIAMVATLMALLLPALASSIGSARDFRCKAALKSVHFDFTIFADDELHGSRGDDEAWSRGRFRLETFQESQYGVDEFWRWGNASTHTLPDAAGNDPMRCPEVHGELVVRRQIPCSNGAVGPPERISFGFNKRLDRAEINDPRGRPRAVPVLLTSSILDAGGMIPLAWDVDGKVAASRSVLPIYSAPSLDSRGPYAWDKYWYPAFRHGGSANFMFMGGHVAASPTPLDESSWLWAYQPIHK